jgi:flagellar basal-body rod modification protein FlgD
MALEGDSLSISLLGEHEKSSANMQSNQALHASALVGCQVLVVSDSISLNCEESASITIDVPANTKKLILSLFTSSGLLLKRIELGGISTGMFVYCWDGCNQLGEKMPAGRYSLLVEGTYEGKNVVIPAMIAANVDSVRLDHQGDGVKLNVAGIGEVALDQVRFMSRI